MNTYQLHELLGTMVPGQQISTGFQWFYILGARTSSGIALIRAKLLASSLWQPNALS